MDALLTSDCFFIENSEPSAPKENVNAIAKKQAERCLKENLFIVTSPPEKYV